MCLWSDIDSSPETCKLVMVLGVLWLHYPSNSIYYGGFIAPVDNAYIVTTNKLKEILTPVFDVRAAPHYVMGICVTAEDPWYNTQLTVTYYWCPVKILDVNGEEKEFPLTKSDLSTYFPNRLALSFEAEELPELAEVMAQHWKKTHKIVCRISGEMENDTHTELSIVMPLTSLDSVYDIEKKLDSDDYQESMKSYIFMLKDASSDIIGVMRKLFSDNVLFNFNWDGVHGKRSLSKLKLVNSVLFDVFKLQGRIDFEDSMRRCLTLSHNRHKQRRYLSNKSSSATA
ncbi:uncharacterized protein [Eurosta solidaginis]|uniref:uncharacterized protein n=1 Tax=Eurosta solidaginis TaxID=178769 RepID=UPI003530813B